MKELMVCGTALGLCPMKGFGISQAFITQQLELISSKPI
jgi:hypothetical protein